jgi:hypothetical protein
VEAEVVLLWLWSLEVVVLLWLWSPEAEVEQQLSLWLVVVVEQPW